MNAARAFLAQAAKLLAEDWLFAAFAVGWIALMALLTRLQLLGPMAGPLLFLGLAGLLTESVWRGARK